MRWRRRGTRIVRSPARRAGPCRNDACTGPEARRRIAIGAGMNRRAILTATLLAGALLSGLMVLRHHKQAAIANIGSGRSDYVLRDFELISLDDTGKESFTLRAPLLQQTPGARTMELKTPLFLLPDIAGHYWQVRSATGWVSENRDELRLHGHVVTVNPPEDPRRITMNTE